MVWQNEVREMRLYTVVTFSNIVHDSFEPFKGSLLSGNPVEVSSSWTIVLETAYLRAVDAFHLLLQSTQYSLSAILSIGECFV
jgi:hypothetical protein